MPGCVPEHCHAAYSHGYSKQYKYKCHDCSCNDCRRRDPACPQSSCLRQRELANAIGTEQKTGEESLPFQYPDHRLINQMGRSFRQRLFLLLGIQSFCGKNLLFFQNPRKLLWSLAVDAYVKNHLDHGNRFFIRNPMLLVLLVTTVSVGRFANVLAAGAALM